MGNENSVLLESKVLPLQTKCCLETIKSDAVIPEEQSGKRFFFFFCGVGSRIFKSYCHVKCSSDLFFSLPVPAIYI